jgi:hypothetical protein
MITPQERDRLVTLVSSIYAEGYTEGMMQAAAEYDIRGLIPEAAVRMKGTLKTRIDLVTAAVDKYIDLIERRARDLRAAGLSGDMLFAEVSSYAQHLADSKSEIISEMEFAEARLDGAGHLVDESGMAYEWRFPHFDIGRPGHEECPICEAIRDGAPYTQEEAEAEGFPSFPHPGCDHGWVMAPLGEPSRTEAFPPRA